MRTVDSLVTTTQSKILIDFTLTSLQMKDMDKMKEGQMGH